MKITINLNHSALCDGCPCLRISTVSINSVRHYSANCKHYIQRDEHNNTWGMGLLFDGNRAYSRYRESPIRPQKCIQEHV